MIALESFDINYATEAVRPEALHQFGMYLGGKWYALTAKEGTYREDPIGVLDVTILQENVLDRILGIQDPRTDHRVDFVGGIRGLGELEKRVNEGPKSTWFEPKLRDGLLTHLI